MDTENQENSGKGKARLQAFANEREARRQKVYNCVAHGIRTRLEIADVTKFDASEVSGILNSLEYDDLLESRPSEEKGTGGRRPKNWYIKEEVKKTNTSG